ncbi:MAG: DNA-binding response OmpR family regulator [Bacteroidia bacterium]|jgi:DNA-binding response OmpR family regulator
MNMTDTRILLVEDEANIRQQLVAALAEADICVEACSTLREAQAESPNDYELVLLDLGLPDGDGLDLCRQLRAVGDATPVIVLTARGAPEERVRGLEAGADDYIAKPFHVPELVARIRAVLRRSIVSPIAERLVNGDLWLDPRARKAGLGDKPLEFKRREFDLLMFLLKNPGRAWTRSQLLARVWEQNFNGDERTVDLHVARVRALIEPDADKPSLLQTVWGVGYSMAEAE